MSKKQPAPTIQPFNTVTPYVTKDGSVIREFMHPAVHGNSAQSLAEARISKGKRTLLHRHPKTEELYHVVGGRGEMTLGNACFPIKTGDTVCIPPGTPHRVQALGPTPLRLLCCCSPAYSHEDTELLEAVPVEEEPAKVVQHAGAAKLTGHGDSVLPDYRLLRQSCGLNQATFWGAVQVTQSAGSRYERERSATAQIDLLLRLAYDTERESAGILASLRAALPGDYQPESTLPDILESGETLKHLRKQMRLNQRDFWGVFKIGQAGGSRYEQGRSMPPPLKLLMQLVLSADAQADALMRTLRHRF